MKLLYNVFSYFYHHHHHHIAFKIFLWIFQIKAHLTDKIPAVARAAEIAVKVIEWKP